MLSLCTALGAGAVAKDRTDIVPVFIGEGKTDYRQGSGIGVASSSVGEHVLSVHGVLGSSPSLPTKKLSCKKVVARVAG